MSYNPSRPALPSLGGAVVAAWVGAALAVVLYGWLASEVPLKSDDFAYLAWGLERRSDALAWLWGTWSPHLRPLNALVWWASAGLGIDGEPVRIVQVALWSILVAVVAGVAWRRARTIEAVALAACGMLLDQVFVDLLQWRSWLTTTGTLAGLVVGLAEVTRPSPRWPIVLAAGLFALGFKETGAFTLAAVALAAGPRSLWPIAVVLGTAAVACGHAATYKLGIGFVPSNVVEHLRNLAPVAWAVPALLATAWPAAWPRWTLGLSAACVLLPAPVAGALVAVGAGIAVSGDRRFAVGLLVAWGVPLFGSHHAAQYLLEGWVIVVAAAAWGGRARLQPAVWLMMLLAAMPSAADFWRARWPERADAAEQAVFIATFDPAPASVLCPPPGVKFDYDADVLAWLRRGAHFDYHPCPDGTVPREVGPRSGVWVDPAPRQ